MSTAPTNWLVALATDDDLMTVLGPMLATVQLDALARANKACEAALRPRICLRERRRLMKIYRYWKGATPSFVPYAYYSLDYDYYNRECDYNEVLLPMLEEFGSKFDESSYGVCDHTLLCTKVTKKACTFRFARQALGRLVVPMHALKWLCLGEVDAPNGVVVAMKPGFTLSSFHKEKGIEDHRWVYQQEDLNGVNAKYDPDRVAPHAAQLVVLQKREMAMTCTKLAKAIARLRGPVYRAPLTKKDAPTYYQVRRKMLVPAFRELRGFGVACGHNDLMCTPSGAEDSLWRRYGVDPDDRDEGAYVGYGEFNDEFRNNAPFKKHGLYHNLGDYKRCRVRAVLERAGFVVDWDDSDTKTIELSLREAGAHYDESDNGYESGESEYDTYSDSDGCSLLTDAEEESDEGEEEE